MNNKSWQKQLPLWITYSRIIAGFFMCFLIWVPAPHKAIFMAILFALASFTDYLDGYFARLYKAESTAGKFMDPIADKILVLSALLILMQQGKVDALMVMIIVSRDTIIGGIRAMAAAEQIIIAAKPTGKWKTAIQMMTIPVLFVGDYDASGLVSKVAYYVLWMSVILSIISGWQYTKKYLAERKSI
jgi:CDP-diacylglycerol--glycerol-3-phosphate 3-phosphatidyltransferase